MATRRLRTTQANIANQIHQDAGNKPVGLKGTKRQPEGRSPDKHQPKRSKRTAFGDITNQENNKPEGQKKGQKRSKGQGKGKSVAIVHKAKKPRSSQENAGEAKTEDVSWDVIELSQGSRLSSSQGSNSNDVDEDISLLNQLNAFVSQEKKPEETSEAEQAEQKPEIDDIDTEQLKDPFQVSLYAFHIFNYYKEREAKMMLPDYMKKQKDLSSHMRAILVDWLVEVQENFELNHETLYLAVKLVDHFLASQPVLRDRLQLVGATALFIACKFDERCPPVLDDFLYICDDAYKRRDIILMEQKILKAINFDLGFPLSYRFLRRYAKCARANIETLTLARYILERSLMDYKITLHRDSELGAAALLLAMKMNATKEWNATMVHYTGYTEDELLPLVVKLNKMISAPPSSQLNTIRTKYSHRVFHEVAKIPPLTNLEVTDLPSSESSTTPGSDSPGSTSTVTDSPGSTSTLSGSPASTSTRSDSPGATSTQSDSPASMSTRSDSPASTSTETSSARSTSSNTSSVSSKSGSRSTLPS